MRSRSLLLFVVSLVALAGCPLLGGTSIEEKEMDAFDRVNRERTSRGLGALVMDEAVRLVARAHSEDMVARDFFSHTNPDGQGPSGRLDAVGIGYNSAGENIAWNNFSNPVTTAVNGWMDSEGHRQNILWEWYTHTGMGVAPDGSGGYYFTQVFIRPSKKAPEGAVQVLYCEPLALTWD